MRNFAIASLLLLSYSCGNKPQKIFYDLVIENIKIFDGDKIIDDATILVKNGVISHISLETGRSYSGTKVINGKGKMLIPGLINAHVHAFSNENLKEAAKAGVLTLIDLFNAPSNVLEQKTYSDSSQYAYYYSSGFAVTAPKGHTTQYGFPVPTISVPDAAESFVEERLKEGSDFIKIILEPGDKQDPIPTISDSILSSILQVTNKKKLLSIVHVSKRKDAVRAAQLGASGIAHIWKRDSSKITNSELDILSDASIFLVPTLLVRKRIIEEKPHSIYMNMEQLQEEVYKLHKAGITILAGTDPPSYGIDYGRDLYKELKLLVESGLSPVEALRAATSNTSKRFHLGQKGYIKTGYSADFVLINGDPSKNIDDLNLIMAVWKSGRLIIR